MAVLLGSVRLEPENIHILDYLEGGVAVLTGVGLEPENSHILDCQVVGGGWGCPPSVRLDWGKCNWNYVSSV